MTMLSSRRWIPILLLVTAASLGAGAALTAPVEHEVLLTDIRFVPNRLEVSVGDRIRFTNKDAFKHDVFLVRTANRNIVVVPRTTLASGQSTVITIEDPGLYSLYCTIHGGMSGLISTTGSFELSAEEAERLSKVKTVPPIAKEGEALFWGRAQCYRCHSIGDRGDGLRGPNLSDIGFRAGARAEALGLDSATAYLLQSVLHPSAYIVEGFSDDMPRVYRPPIDLDKDQLTAVVSYLQSQGGEVDTWSIEIDDALLDAAPPPDPFTIGDPEQGKEVFGKLGCKSCHAARGYPDGWGGPNLSAIGSVRDWTWLATSILEPNREVGANWHDVKIRLKSKAAAGGGSGWSVPKKSSEVSGVLRENAPDTVTVLVGPHTIRAVPRGRIDTMTVNSGSRMPVGYADLLTFRQFADVIRYLEAYTGPGGER